VRSSNSKRLHETDLQADPADHVSVDSEAAVMDNRFTHLSAFALNGRDGDVRWHHVVGDFEKSHKKVLKTAVAGEFCRAVVYMSL